MPIVKEMLEHLPGNSAARVRETLGKMLKDRKRSGNLCSQGICAVGEFVQSGNLCSRGILIVAAQRNAGNQTVV